MGYSLYLSNNDKSSKKQMNIDVVSHKGGMFGIQT